MTMAPPDRSKRLHNFTLPCLKWGHQRHLRCVNLQPSSSSSPDRSLPNGFQSKPVNLDATQSSKSSPNFDAWKETGEDIEMGERKKLRFDLRFEEKKVKDSFLGGEEEGRDESIPLRPWNLRTRRAACNEPREETKLDSPGRDDCATVVAKDDGEKKERVKFAVSLLREEIVEDFLAMTGKRPPRRPKKRARVVQKQVISVFPGLWLTEITEDLYKVSDLPES